MLLITIIGTAFPLMWVDFWRFFGSVLEKAWKGPPWVLEVNSSCAVECFSVLRHRLTGQKLEMVHEKFLAPRVEEDQWTVLFIYLFIYRFLSPLLVSATTACFCCGRFTLGSSTTATYLYYRPCVWKFNQRKDMISHPYDISCFKEKFYLSVVDLLQ